MRRVVSSLMTVVFFAGLVTAQADWTKLLQKAKTERKFILAYFTDHQCFQCQSYSNQIKADLIGPPLHRFLFVKFDIKRDEQILKKLLPNWQKVLPVTIITDDKGKRMDYFIGHLDSDTFASYLTSFLAGKYNETIEKRLKQKPNDLPTIYEAAVWYLELGNGNKGLPLAKRLLKLDPINEKGYHVPMRLHIGLYYAKHRVYQSEQAIKEFRTVVDKFPKTKSADEARFYLATVHLALGQDAEARKWLNEVLKNNKSPNLRQQAQKLLNFLNKEPPADLRRGD